MRSFFFTINQTINAFKRPHAGGEKKSETEDLSIKKSEAYTRIAITFVLILIILYLFKFDTSENSYSEMASTIMGALLGYWFR